MNSDSLKESILQYETQLANVLNSIQSENISGRDDLYKLKTDLEQLIQVSKDYLAEISEPECESNRTDQNDVDDEYSNFMQEIAQLEATQEQTSAASSPEGSYLKDLLESIVGMKCIVSHTHNSGREELHLAMVCEIHNPSQVQNLEDIQVKIMFTHPTIKRMLPCPYYLNADCKYDDSRCRYSHGEIVPFVKLKDYDEPNYSIIDVGDTVLVKQENQLWNKGEISSVDCDIVTVLMDDKKESTVKLEEVIPIGQITSVDKPSNSDLSSDEDSYSENQEIQTQLHDVKSRHTTDLADWEKHTKGIGSKLMLAMGYKMGSGLGKECEGRVDPIDVQVLPPRMSLDHCMKLREEAGDQDIFCMNRQLMKLKKNIQRKLAEEGGSIRKKDSNVFSFINNMFSGQKENSEEFSHRSLINSSNKSLNLSSFHISESMKKTEKDIAKYEESLKRQKINSLSYKEILQKMTVKKEELTKLKLKDYAVTEEQNSRKEKTKLNIF